MPTGFHRSLNRMALFTALAAVLLIFFWRDFLAVAVSNVILNGIIIGTALFGIGLCFVDMFRLLPEHRWLRAYGRGTSARMPRLLRPVAVILGNGGRTLSARTLGGLMDMIAVRFEDQRESVRYVTNTLIFLGLLGTFWGLILTVGGFADLIGNLDFQDETVLTTMQMGLARPLAGMATAFTSSLLGLGSSLIVGFLGLQVQLAQNGIYRSVEDLLSTRTQVMDADNAAALGAALRGVNMAVSRLEKSVSKMTE